MKTTSPMIPLQYQQLNVEEILSISSVKKFDGFLRLTTLNLAHNLIDSMENLLGVIFMPSLKNIYIQGNPVMNGCVPKHLQSKRRLAAKIGK